MADPNNPKEPPILFGGSCACGRITYQSSSLLPASTMCHCVTCRKLGGAPFQAFSDVVDNGVTFYDNKERLSVGLPKDSVGGITFLRFSKVGERAFCVDCYSPLAMRYQKEGGNIFGLTLSSVDDETIRDDKVKEALKPTSHIFVGQNPWWYDVRMDGLPTHERFDGDFEQKMKEWENEKR